MLFAKVSVVMLAALLAGLALGCTEEIPRPVLLKVLPARVYTDRVQRLTLLGNEFLPRFRFELSEGRRHADFVGYGGLVWNDTAVAPLRDFAGLDTDTLFATLDPGLPRGTYSVQVSDPRGANTFIPDMFHALGPDVEAPRLTLESPAATDILAPGTPVLGRVLAEDEGLSKISWRAEGARGRIAEGTCLPRPPAEAAPPSDKPPDGPEGPLVRRMSCEFAFEVPLDLAAGQPITFQVSAADDAPAANLATFSRLFMLRARPVVTHLDPPRGAAEGGTDVVIKGLGLPPGTRVMVGDKPLLPGGGTRLDDRTIIGHIPPGRPGAVSVRLLTPLGEITHARLFEYLAPPTPLALEPPEGPSAGGGVVVVRGENFTPQTRVLLGTTLGTARPLLDVTFVDSSLLRGLLPPGHGQATVFTVDAEAGVGQLAGAFLWNSDP